MIARTIGDMIAMLDRYPLDIDLRDEFGDLYSINTVVASNRSEFPILTMTKYKASVDETTARTTMELMSLLIDLSMDKRFDGKNSEVLHAGKNFGPQFAQHGYGPFALMRGIDRPLIKLEVGQYLG